MEKKLVNRGLAGREGGWKLRVRGGDVRRIDTLNLLSITTLHKLAIDIQAKRLLILATIRSRELGEEVGRHSGGGGA